jgi:hypothetical protein
MGERLVALPESNRRVPAQHRYFLPIDSRADDAFWLDFKLPAHCRANIRKPSAFIKHALSAHIATAVAALTPASTVRMRRFFPCEIRMLTVALRRARMGQREKVLKKKAFQRRWVRKTLAKVHAYAIFRADSLYAAAVATAFLRSQIHSRSSAVWRKRVAHRQSRKS